MKKTKDEIMEKFLSLSNALSPENLHCDGEASREQVQNKLKHIKASWDKLEKEIGYTVTEDDAWNYSIQKRKKESAQTKQNLFGTRN